MKPLSDPKTMKWILVVLGVILLVKLLWLAVEMTVLPTVGINQVEEVGGKPLYYRVNLSKNKVLVPKKEKRRSPVGSIKDIKLLAIYNAEDVTVVTVVYKHKSKVLARGETINGFRLDGAGSTYAIFSKQGKRYQVELIKGEQGSGSGSISPVRHTSAAKRASGSAEGEVVDAGDHKIVDRSLIDHYANVENMNEIYKNIGITEVKQGKQIKGFKITFVKRGSPFAKLGIRRGDIIKSINGEEITSYNAAFNIYKNIANMENLTLVILRGKEEMELDYEIN
jgi:general secretion pathway protein C